MCQNLWSFQVRSVCSYGFTRVEPPICYPPPFPSVPGIMPSSPGRESCVLCACATFPPSQAGELSSPVADFSSLDSSAVI